MLLNEPASISFLVTITATEAPPDWSAKIEKQVRRELFLLYGNNAIVTRFRSVLAHGDVEIE